MKTRESFAISFRSTITIVFASLAFAALFFGGARFAVSSAATDEKKDDRPVTIQTRNDGPSNISLINGADLNVPVERLKGEQPTHLALADFDSDGIADLVTVDTSGKIRLYKGNGNIQIEGAEPFELTANVFQLRFSADFIVSGDFNADGYKDILAAAKGGNFLVLLAGDGRGNFAEATPIQLDGNITAFSAGEIGQVDGQTDIAVAVTNTNGPFLLVFEHPEGAFKHKPETFKLPAPASDIAIGNLDGDFFSDIAVACGDMLTVVHERGQAYPWDIVKGADIQRPPAVVAIRQMPFGIAELSIGEFSVEKGQSLAILADNGSIYQLQPTRSGIVNPRVSSELNNKTTQPQFMPTSAEAKNLRFARASRQSPESADADGAMPDPSRSQQENQEEARKKQDEAAKKFLALGKAEQSRIITESIEQSRASRERAKAGFLRTISAQPSTLASWKMETIASDARFRGASTQNAKKLITARVSTSGLDDLLLLDAVSRQIHIISQPKTEGMPTPEIASLDVDGGPLALLTVRLNHDAMDDLVILRLGASQPSIVMTAPTTVITVNDAGDQPGNCGGGTCTLRSAIIAANGLPGSTIAFNIPGGGVHTISPFSELPVVRTAVTIDGSTQPGYAGTPVIEIKGNNFQAGQAIDGLKIRASNCSVYGLAINEFPGSQDPDTGSVTGGNGLTLESTTLSPNNGHNFIQGNFLGTAPNGLVSKGNRSTGILVFSSGSNTINGNLMSGNGGFGLDVTAGNGNLIIANRIGVAADGHTKLGNTNGVFLTGSNNEFGGDAPNYGNTVSGNGVLAPQSGGCGGEGITIPLLVNVDTGELLTQFNYLKGNKIGTDPSGTLPAGNCSWGINTEPLASTVIGSITQNGRNVVSDNGYDAMYCMELFGDSHTLSEGGFCAIIGNNIGTDVTGTVALPNDKRNVFINLGIITSAVTIRNNNSFSNFGAPGGTTPGGNCTGFCNLLSGNGESPFSRFGLGTVGVFNNYVGTNRSGTQALPNQNTALFASLPPFGLSSDTFFGGVGDQFGVPGASLGNVISGNYGGINISNQVLDGFTGNFTIEGNLIGTDAQGINAIPNGCDQCDNSGIAIISTTFPNIQIGDTGPLARNIIAGNASGFNTIGAGILMQQNPFADIKIVNNYIGVNKAGAALGNRGAGIAFFNQGGATIGGSTAAEENLIQNNGRAGIRLSSFVVGGQPLYPSGVNIQRNKIKNNAGLGIDLSAGSTDDGVTANDCQDSDVGPNELQNYPVLLAPVFNGGGTVMVPASFSSEPLRDYRIDFYASATADPTNYGEGENFIGSTNVITNGNGAVAFDFTSTSTVAAGSVITATATNDLGSTSEFSCAAGVCASGSSNIEERLNRVQQDACPLQNIVVNVTSDENEDPASQGTVCNVDPNATPGHEKCTLRAAIHEAIYRSLHGQGRWTINFNIPGAGVHTISPLTKLPLITQPVTIDGTTQPGYTDSPIIEVSGVNVADPANGLEIQGDAANSAVSGLVINSWKKSQIAIVNTEHVKVEACFIGVNSDGVSAPPTSTPQDIGISIHSSRSSGIGDLQLNRGNVISGNIAEGILIDGVGSYNEAIANNKIGTDKTGMVAIPNGVGISYDGDTAPNRATTAFGKNLISGNTVDGIRCSDPNDLAIYDNLIGTKADGIGKLGNGGAGIAISDAQWPASIKFNVISNNGGGIGISRTTDHSPLTKSEIHDNHIGVNSDNNQNLGNHDQGIVLLGVQSTEIFNNFIGGNGKEGILLSSYSGTGSTAGTANTSIHDNHIGLAADHGNPAIPNKTGIRMVGGLNSSFPSDNSTSHNRVFNNSIAGNQTGIAINEGANSNGIGDFDSHGIGAGNTITGSTSGLGYGIFIGPTDNPGAVPLPTGNTVILNKVTFNSVGLVINGGQGNTIGSDTRLALANSFLDNTGEAIRLVGQSTHGNLISFNNIGATSDGSTNNSHGNGGDGIYITDTARNDVKNNTIGFNHGNGISIFNLFAGTDFGAVISGNQIGVLDAIGQNIGNVQSGILINSVQNVLIGVDGVTSSEPKNVIAGNGGDGISIHGAGTKFIKITNSVIGTNNSGAAGFGNGGHGIFVSGADNTIGGNQSVGNVIAGNHLEGINIQSSDRNTILGNSIGVVTNNGGTNVPLPNGGDGIAVANSQQNNIGASGILFTYSNIIGGNAGDGILVSGVRSSATAISKNLIGTDSHDTNLANGSNGVHFTNSASHNFVGGSDDINAGNTIAHNAGKGVFIDDTALCCNLVDPNSIYGNGGLGIALGNSAGVLPNDPGDADTGPNNLQNYPEIINKSIDGSGNLILSYKVDSLPANSNYGSGGLRVEFFKADNRGQGAQFLGFDNYTVSDHAGSSAGTKTINLGNAAAMGIAPADNVTATATDADGNTSEFFPPFQPTAAGVTISGRVTTHDGGGVRNATVSLVNSHGVNRSTTTSSFGYFSFDDVVTGETYVIGVSTRRYRFASRVLQVLDSLADVDFVGLE